MRFLKFPQADLSWCLDSVILISVKNRYILHQNPHSHFVQAYIESDGTDDTTSRLSVVEETGVPRENHRQQWVNG